MIPAERNYDVREKECLAIKYTLAQLRHYLLASRFTVKCLSDHRSLQFLKKGKEIGGRIARWALALGEFDYEIEYIKGADNQLADLLSRMVKAETLPANRLHLGDLDQTKPKVQLANISADIARCVWLFNCAGPTDLDEREADAEEARDPSLFRARHWVKGPGIPEEYPPHKANIEQAHESLMFAAVRYHQTFVRISKEDYEDCLDFGEIYMIAATMAKTLGTKAKTLGASMEGGRTKKRAPTKFGSCLPG